MSFEKKSSIKMDLESNLTLAIHHFKIVLENASVDLGHGLDHALQVVQHVEAALQVDPLELKPTPRHQLLIKLSALLHDADDAKFFTTVNYSNARSILEKLDLENSEREQVIRMIDLVSCRKNRHQPPNPEEPSWYLYPRHADRLEAVGNIGLIRCYQYNLHTDLPFFVESTPRVTDREELARVAPPSRFLQYRGVSASLVDHLYDKVLHLGVETGNSYFDTEFKRRINDIEEFCFQFGRTGTCDHLFTLMKTY